MLVEERDFLSHGGEKLHFGSVVDGTVCLRVDGSPDSIRRLAGMICAHRTAATRRRATIDHVGPVAAVEICN